MDERVRLQARIDSLLDHVVSLTAAKDLAEEKLAYTEARLEACWEAHPEMMEKA